MINRKKQCGHLRCGAICSRPSKKKKPKWIPRVSEKRKIENELYFRQREVFLQEHPKCECGRPGCNRKSVEIHHTKGRGKYFLDMSTWKAVARVCHRWAEENPEEAKKIGISQNRLT